MIFQEIAKSQCRNYSNDQFDIKGDFFEIEELPQTDTARLNTFLDDLSLLLVDEYVTEPPKI